MTTKITCECGSVVLKSSLTRHLNTKKHKSFAIQEEPQDELIRALETLKIEPQEEHIYTTEEMLTSEHKMWRIWPDGAITPIDEEGNVITL